MANTLRIDLDDISTVIKLEQSTSFPASGMVQIDSEAISYEFSSDLFLMNCVRGIDGTTAAAHLAGADVVPYTLAPVVPAYVLPTVDGTDGQVLMTDGAGAVTWQTLP
jgi:hypothetical protein